MAISVVMPALEMAQETGKLLAWRKKEGERVTKGEPLLEIETDKAVVEIEAPADGILAGIIGTAGADIPVGKTIGWIVVPAKNLPLRTNLRRLQRGQRRKRTPLWLRRMLPKHLPLRAQGFLPRLDVW